MSTTAASQPPSHSSSKSQLGSESSNKSSIPSSIRHKPLNITLGCEFELLLAHYVGPGKAVSEESSDYDAPGKKLIHNVLKAKLVAICEQCDIEHEFELRLRDHGRFYDEDYEKWQRGDDETVKANCGERIALGKNANDYDIYCVELKTRKFDVVPDEHKTCGHLFTYSEEITAVLKRLEHSFGGFGRNGLTESFLFTNMSCGFHVHVGRSANTFPLSTVKKVMSLSLACERQIDGLHFQNRINGFNYDMPFALPEKALYDPNVIDASTYPCPLSMFFIDEANNRRRRDYRVYGCDLPPADKDLERHTRTYPQNKWGNTANWNARRGNDIDSWVTLIQNAPNLDSLRDLHHREGRICVLNIDNLRPWPQDSDSDLDSLATSNGLDEKRTIEFKQHGATLHPRMTLSFIDFATSLISFCHNTSDEAFYKLIRLDGAFCRPEFSTLNLCQKIGCSLKTQSYYAQQLHGDLLTRWLDERETSAGVATVKGDPLGNLALNAIDMERKNTSQSDVQERIAIKLIRGGYGQFTPDILDAILPDDVAGNVRERLTLGTFGPRSSKSAMATELPDEGSDSQSDSLEVLSSKNMSDSDHVDFTDDPPSLTAPRPLSRSSSSTSSKSGKPNAPGVASGKAKSQGSLPNKAALNKPLPPSKLRDHRSRGE